MIAPVVNRLPILWPAPVKSIVAVTVLVVFILAMAVLVAPVFAQSVSTIETRSVPQEAVTTP